MTVKRRVALVRNIFLPYSETFIHDELRHHERYETTVFTRQWRNADRFPGHRVISVERIPDRRHPLASLVYSLTGRSWGHERALREGGFDLVHAHFGHNGIQGMQLARRQGLPLVVTLHGRDVTLLMGHSKYAPEWWHYLLGYRALFRYASLFLAASSELRDLIVGCGCPEEKVRVHRLGVDLTRFSPTPKPPQGPPRVLMVGRFVEKKGHQYALHAAKLVRERGIIFKLVLVGDGPLRPACERLVMELGLGDRVEFTGILSPDQVQTRLQEASLLLAPSVVASNLDRESGVISAKEAGACGLPVLATRHGGLPEIVDHGTTGFLVAERNPQALATRLQELLQDPELRRRMGAAGRLKMEREYNIRECVRGLEKHYDNVIASWTGTQP